MPERTLPAWHGSRARGTIDLAITQLAPAVLLTQHAAGGLLQHGAELDTFTAMHVKPSALLQLPLRLSSYGLCGRWLRTCAWPGAGVQLGMSSLRMQDSRWDLPGPVRCQSTLVAACHPGSRGGSAEIRMTYARSRGVSKALQAASHVHCALLCTATCSRVRACACTLHDRA